MTETPPGSGHTGGAPSPAAEEAAAGIGNMGERDDPGDDYQDRMS